MGWNFTYFFCIIFITLQMNGVPAMGAMPVDPSMYAMQQQGPNPYYPQPSPNTYQPNQFVAQQEFSMGPQGVYISPEQQQFSQMPYGNFPPGYNPKYPNSEYNRETVRPYLKQMSYGDRLKLLGSSVLPSIANPSLSLKIGNAFYLKTGFGSDKQKPYPGYSGYAGSPGLPGYPGSPGLPGYSGSQYAGYSGSPQYPGPPGYGGLNSPMPMNGPNPAMGYGGSYQAAPMNGGYPPTGYNMPPPPNPTGAYGAQNYPYQ